MLNEEARIIHPDTRDIYIISHSKAKHLKTVIPGRLRVRIHIYNQSGADISSDIVRTAMNRIRLAQEPIILIWFGTCELSVKNGKFSKIIDYPYQEVEQILTRYRVVKQSILAANPSVKITFIECPYISILRWNKFQGFQINTESKKKNTIQDTKLNTVIKYYNQRLDYINTGSHIPKISQDQIICSKKKRLRRTKIKVKDNLLHDGIDPKRSLLRLWMQIIVKYSRTL